LESIQFDLATLKKLGANATVFSVAPDSKFSLFSKLTQAIQKGANPQFDFCKISLEDPKTFAILSKGEAWGCYPFFKLPPVQAILRKIQPQSFQDLLNDQMFDYFKEQLNINKTGTAVQLLYGYRAAYVLANYPDEFVDAYAEVHRWDLSARYDKNSMSVNRSKTDAARLVEIRKLEVKQALKTGLPIRDFDGF
jgi:hypothetical protein